MLFQKIITYFSILRFSIVQSNIAESSEIGLKGIVEQKHTRKDLVSYNTTASNLEQSH